MDEITLVPVTGDAAKDQKEQYAITLRFENKGITEQYSIKTKPSAKSELVRFSEKSILQNLSVREVVTGLDHAADLMFLAYNALAKRALQATVSGLQKSLLDATLEATVTMGVFKTKSAAIVEDAFNAYTWMIRGKESLALKQLQRCGDTATKMADEAEKLAARFQNIVDASQKAAEAAIEEKVSDQNTKKKLQEKLNQIKVLQAKTQELQKNIEADLKNAQKEYEEAREREKVEGERAFITGIIGATVGALASGIGSVAQAAIAIKSPFGLLGGYVPPTQAGGNQPSTQAPSPEAQQKKENLSQQLREKEEARSAINQEKRENDAKLEKAEKIIKDPAAPAQLKADAEKDKAEAEAKRADIEKRLKGAEEAVKTLLSGLSDVSKQLQQISSQSYSAAETASKQKMAYYEHRNQLAAENREALASLAQYVVELKYTNEETNNIEMAIKSLEFAIQALQGVVSALSQTTKFWRQMASYCRESLGSNNFIDDLGFMIEYFTLKERQDYYSSEEFIKPALVNIAQWVALNNVCSQYLEAVNEVYGKVNKNHGNPPSDDEAAAQVAQLAQAVLTSAEKEQAAIDDEINSFRHQMQTITVQAQTVR
jgi:DNA repair exonuclease SbcCD ATPase subunit